MDILSLSTKKKSNEGVVYHVLHPVTRQPLRDENGDVTLTLLGADSDAWRSAMHKIKNERIAGTRGTQTSEQLEAEAIEELAVITIGWSNMQVGGDSEFSRANVIKAYTDLPWLKEQVDIFVGNRANFF